MVETNLTRRKASALLTASLVGVLVGARAAFASVPSLQAIVQPRMRVVLDNDFAGDPDGLFQLLQHALSPSVEIPLIVASHLHPGEVWYDDAKIAADGARRARELLAMIPDSEAASPILAGSELAMKGAGPDKSPATDAIIREAMREDTDLPLFYAAGAGLTELALAWRKEPRIGKRLKLVWIGGSEHAGLAASPPGGTPSEYNLTIDTEAAQVVFNESDIEIWQVPRDAYRQMLFSYAQLDELARGGPIGAYLCDKIAHVNRFYEEATKGEKPGLGETYVLGDNPLVTLTALQSSFEADPSSSSYVAMPTPRIDDNGLYAARPEGRPMRVYTRVDTRLTFADMRAKLRAVGG